MSPWTFFIGHRAEIFEATLAHLGLVVIAMAVAIGVAVPLGMLMVGRPTLRSFALGVASVFQTIPSLALFGFLIPIPFIGGIGARTAMVALVLYALLFIYNNSGKQVDFWWWFGKPTTASVFTLSLVAFLSGVIGAILAYDPSRGFRRRGPAGGET